MKEYLTQLAGAEAFLREQFGANVQHVQELGRGEWSVAFAYHLDGRDYVARFGLYDEDFLKDRFVAQYASASVPIPQISEIGRYKNGFYAISERAYGQFLDHLGGEAMRAVLPNLLDTLYAVREVKLDDTSGFGFWDAKGVGHYTSWHEALLGVVDDRPERRIYGWRKSLEEKPEYQALFEQAVALFVEKIAYCPTERHLIHNDLLNRNILVEGDRISALLDWGDARFGDHLYDIAHLLYWWPWFTQWRNIDVVGEIERHYQAKQQELGNFHVRIQCYQMHIGLGAMAYHCYTKRWDDFMWNARRTLEIARSE